MEMTRSPLTVGKDTVYISGPITGLPDLNKPYFKKVEEQLDAHTVPNVNPQDLFDYVDTTNFSHQNYMDICICWMAKCGTVVTLNGWQESKGAKQEVDIARLMGKEVIPIEVFLKKLEESEPENQTATQ